MPAATPPAKRQKVVSVPDKPKVIDIVKSPEGDLVLQVGDPVKRNLLRVHSGSLRMASPVFRGMLGGNFIEGSTQYTAEDPLCLTEDNARAMLDLCKLIHHQYAMHDPLSVYRFPKLVILADKYQCLSIVRPWFLAAVTQHFTSSITEGWDEVDALGFGWGDAMCIAYALEDAQLFWRISRSAIVRYDTESLNKRMSEGLVDLMPKGFLGAIQNLLTCERERLVTALEKAEARILRCPVPCGKGRYMIAEYNHRLFSYGLKRTSTTAKTWDCLREAWQAIQDTAYFCDISNAEIKKIRCTRGCLNCPDNTFAKHLREIVETSKKYCKGLCLECTRGGSEDKPGAECGHKFKT